jgi:hypothetical protein
MNDDMECPRCAELRGRSVKMHTIKIGPPNRTIKTAYECPSCDFVIPLVPFTLPATVAWQAKAADSSPEQHKQG